MENFPTLILGKKNNDSIISKNVTEAITIVAIIKTAAIIYLLRINVNNNLLLCL